MPLRRPYKRPSLPDGPFVLVFDGTDNGPWDPEHAEYREDGSVVLHSDGLPVTLKVIRQQGETLTLEGGTSARIRPIDLAYDFSDA